MTEASNNSLAAKALHYLYAKTKRIGIKFIPLQYSYFDFEGNMVDKEFRAAVYAENFDSRGDECASPNMLEAMFGHANKTGTPKSRDREGQTQNETVAKSQRSAASSTPETSRRNTQRSHESDPATLAAACLIIQQRESQFASSSSTAENAEDNASRIGRSNADEEK